MGPLNAEYFFCAKGLFFLWKACFYGKESSICDKINGWSFYKQV
ncbi:hypothetical protein EAL2_c06660 [Peptoclostridium acidaminophilum DSM 3953]|uniref:Uncharacterized protein n=1 Tax=Peptoclostridium acidaminophilum DSM 3953 TaxID=1286171 RepID=W8TID2_PEPAC|nr:hypothetical protein EAL2_c06660 [Peptoclostridium acidaminophilum DSM 3953]